MKPAAPSHARDGWLSALAPLYTARFFRRRYPITPALCEAISRGAMATPRRLPTLYIWGAHEKRALDVADEDTLQHLRALLARIESMLEIPVAPQVVIADSHAQLNEIDPETSSSYAESIALRMREYGWNVHRMSDLWKEAGITLERIVKEATDMDVVSHAPRLLIFAGRHYRGASTDDGARRYLVARLLEKPLLSKRFSHHIFMTPVEPSLDFVQPDLPTFHIWTRKKGCSAKPWFTQEGAA
jgi:hypothetical protein